MYKLMKKLLVVPELWHVLGVVGSMMPMILERRKFICCSIYTILCRSRNRDKFPRHALQNRAMYKQSAVLAAEVSMHTSQNWFTRVESNALGMPQQHYPPHAHRPADRGQNFFDAFTGWHQTTQLDASSACFLIS